MKNERLGMEEAVSGESGEVPLPKLNSQHSGNQSSFDKKVTVLTHTKDLESVAGLEVDVFVFSDYPAIDFKARIVVPAIVRK